MAARQVFKYGLLALFISATLTGCGLDGDDGAQGEQGLQGPQGDPGQDGAPGQDGQDGQDGQNGQDASIGISMEIVARASLGASGSAEIVDFHTATQTIYATNSANGTIAIIDASGVTSTALSDPINLTNLAVATITLPTEFEGVTLGGVNSLAVSGDLMAVAVAGATQADNGYVLFYNGLDDSAPALLDGVEVGNLPDMVKFTPDGGKVVVANEGEPNGDYSNDPEGSISVIDILANNEPEEVADQVTLESLNGTQADLEAQGMHFPNPTGRTINGNAITITVAQDLEPEAVTLTNDTAYVTLQENNGVLVLDLEDLSFEVVGLGFKDWDGLNIDANEDGAVSFGQYEGLYGVYMPDTISHYEWKGATFLVTANEGDAREYFFDAADEAACLAAGGLEFDADDGCLAYTDEVKVEDLTAEAGSLLESLQMGGEINGLRVTSVLGDSDDDGEYDAAYAYGSRSFTIWDQNGLVVYDSGDDFERITASVHGDQFNNNDDENESDSRSENKGPEPEALTVGTIGNRTYAFIGLERMGGIMVYDVTNPYDVQFADYVINRDLTEGLTPADVIGDLAPESLVFVSSADSPTGQPLLITGNEVSGTVSVWEITPN
ncbi:choice-of-anchor I family protein [Alteromonas sp. ASW11-36]|uniref:Choice-of-anchor I family protein n=1 Tax=Alteromonas arenosi TaxID=3055817 RepID=A0ABT7STJ0_9ALTE|nr:choice-of-anchor I family protein [Alteromonas sp. ASW11-36]MDM7859512.1 choice-of-anchor I family protein [Alteromonas sp. ASW11-36]